MSKSVQMSPAVVSRAMHRLPNLPEDENINWGKEIYGTKSSHSLTHSLIEESIHSIFYSRTYSLTYSLTQ
jgi:hypothetical protein